MLKSSSAPRLSTRVRRQLLGMGTALFVLSVVLILLFTLRVTDAVFAVAEALEAELLIEELAANPGMDLPRRRTLSAYKAFEDIPQSIRRSFEDTPPLPGELLDATGVDARSGAREVIYLSRHQGGDSQELFLLSRYPADRADQLFSQWLWSVSGQILLVTGVSFLLLLFLVRWLIRRTTEPLRLLHRWAEGLSENPDAIRQADFPIEELNRLAAHIRQGVEKVQAYNRREEEFLRYASHELRTPVAILQASMDTLALQAPPESSGALARAQRASDRMQQLISSLLFLARDPERTTPLQKVDVAAVVSQCLSDHQWIVDRRGLTVCAELAPHSLRTEETLLTIVASNLIRNAVSHGADGAVDLKVDHRGLTVSNAISGDVTESTESNGLGLLLVERICERLHWDYRFEQTATRVTVCVHWPLHQA